MIHPSIFFSVWAIALVGCTSAAPIDPPASEQVRKKDPKVTRIYVVVGEQRLLATLDDSTAARDFAALLPLELTLRDYASTEKIADLPRKLNTQGAPSSYAAKVGDITYYAPWGNLAIFYKDFREASGLVRLGAFDGDIKALLRSESFKVRVEAAPAAP